MASTSTSTPTTTPSVDSGALNLTRAIALTESGSDGKPNYNATGQSGEKGAYQWMPGNFETSAKEAGLNPGDFSPENQDKVAYFKIKQYKDQGYQPWEIASLWNSGDPHNYTNHSGVNSKGVAYDTPAYVKNVRENYTKVSATQAPSMKVTDTGTGQNQQQNTSASSSEVTPLAAIGNLAGSFASALGSAVGDVSHGFAKSAIRNTVNLGSVGEEALDQTAGRVINAATGKGFVPTKTGASARAFTGQSGLQSNNLGEEVGTGVENAVEFTSPGPAEERIGALVADVGKAAGSMVGKTFPSIMGAAEKVGSGLARHAPAFALNTGIGTVQSKGDIKSSSEGAGFGEIGNAALSGLGILGKAVSNTEAVSQAKQFMNKALSSTGKKSAAGLLGSEGKKLKGLETIYKYAKGMVVKGVDGIEKDFDPRTADFYELTQALVQTKRKIWAGVQDAISKGAELKPDISNATTALEGIMDKESGRTSEAINHATKRLDELKNLKTPQQIQTYLQDLNTRIGGAITGASDKVTTSIDAEIANHLNTSLDEALDKVEGASIRPLKDEYSSLKAIEQSVVTRTQQAMRRSGHGLPGYMSDFGSIDLIEAAFTHNPALYLVKGTAMKAFAAINDHLKSPTRSLRKAFQYIDQYTKAAIPSTS